jgi:hypothetical protein
LVPFGEKMQLHQALVMFGGFLQGIKCPQMPALASFWITLLRIETIFAGFKFSYHAVYNGPWTA